MDSIGDRWWLVIGVMSVGMLSDVNSWAWDNHSSLMPAIVESLPEELGSKVDLAYPAPCPESDRKTYQKLAQKLGLNFETWLASTSPGGVCGAGARIQLRQVLLGTSTDDPDSGMDQNLPATADPHRYRKFMGGETGPTSQGFRHMYFGGWQLSRPIVTFQVPVHAIGEAPDRTQLLADAARDLFLNERQPVWGARVMGWSLHFVQDLAQPFHSVQIPNLAMVPWSALLQWPPQSGFGNLVKETTRTISNYHWAYEGYTLSQMQLGKRSPFHDCLDHPEKYTQFRYNPATQVPRDLAMEIYEKSVGLASEMGQSCVAFFGAHLKEPHYDLANGKGLLDYPALGKNPKLEGPRQRLHDVTCEAMANASMGSRLLMEWVMKGVAESTQAALLGTGATAL